VLIAALNVHVATVLADSFTSIGLLDALVPATPNGVRSDQISGEGASKARTR